MAILSDKLTDVARAIVENATHIGRIHVNADSVATNVGLRTIANTGLVPVGLNEDYVLELKVVHRPGHGYRAEYPRFSD